jgi:hypothetical protein
MRNYAEHINQPDSASPLGLFLPFGRDDETVPAECGDELRPGALSVAGRIIIEYYNEIK